MNQIFLHLSLIENVGPATVSLILNRTPDGFLLSDLYKLSAHDLMRMFGVREKTAQVLVAGLADKELLEKELALIEKHNVQWLTIADDSYPFLLKNIHQPPTVIYYKGAPLSDAEKTIAVIGARKADRYGEQVIDHLVPQLVQNDWTIVSGGALGADSMAHAATVRAGGKTVVVLGSGLLKLYPASNRDLFNKILDSGGTIVSSFPLKMEAFPGNFPARNRIIAGLSKGCVVVQAAVKSGARITANFALDQGREVFAVPGVIGDELSAGCHALIQMGAKLINSVDDILEEFSGFQPQTKGEANKIRQPRAIQLKISPVEPVPEGPAGVILTVCSNPTSTDDLACQTGLPATKLNGLLFDLQLQGRIQQNFAGLWERL